MWPADAPVLAGTRRTIEAPTRDQSGDIWNKMRKGRVTSTKVGPICQGNDCVKVRDDIINPPGLSHKSYVARGKQDEENGVNYLLDTLKRQGFEARAYPIGLVLHPEYEWLAASPDRLAKVGDHWCLVDVKNWYVTDRQKGIRDLQYLDKNGRLRRTTNHYYQIRTVSIRHEKLLLCCARRGVAD